MENSRLIVAILVAMGVLFAYQEFLQWRYPDLYGPKAKHSPVASPTPIGSATAGLGSSVSALPTPANIPERSAAAQPSAPPTISASPARTFEVDTDTFVATFTSRGARLVSFKLKKYRATDQRNSPPYEMVRPSERLPMGVSIIRNGVAADDGDIDYATDAPAHQVVAQGSSTQLRFVGKRDGVTLQKIFTFQASGYVFDIAAQASSANSGAPLGVGLSMSQPLTELEGYRDYPELQADVNGKALTQQEKALRKGVAPVDGQIKYAGFGDRYFLAVFMPQHPSAGTLAMSFVDQEADAQLLFPAASSVTSRVYMGPKALEVLEAVDPELSKAIDLGFWGVIALPFLRLLKLFYRVVPNYGVAIILLTVLVRLATLPMSIRGQRSMMKMQRLQPQVERIREKFKDDSERLNREMMELYKRNHVNPLGGCLPTAVQFPVFIGLYEALLNAVDLRHAPFVAWIQDLSAPDCLPIAGMPALPFTTCHGLPVLVGLMTISTFVQQWTMPRQPDPNQQKMMMLMPIAFSLFFLTLPAGLSLYYFASNLLGIIQQVILNREFRQPTPETT